jgi:hypothetical protein
MGAYGLVTKFVSIENGILTASLGELTLMTDGATTAWEGFDAALASTGIGAMVIGIGLVVEKLISMNQQLDEAIDKKYKLTESKNDFKSINDQAEQIKEQFKVFDQLTDVGKKKVASDVGEFLKSTRDKIPVLSQRATHLASEASKMPTPSTFDVFLAKANMQNLFSPAANHVTENAAKTHKALDDQTQQLRELGKSFVDVKQIAQTLRAKGYNPSLYTPTGGTNPGKDNAITTSQLTGASGGLGQAKQIHIQIGVVQQNNGVKESKSEADQAVQKIIEALNGFSDSQNSQ